MDRKMKEEDGERKWRGKKYKFSTTNFLEREDKEG